VRASELFLSGEKRGLKLGSGNDVILSAAKNLCDTPRVQPAAHKYDNPVSSPHWLVKERPQGLE
jgi:hypothetical protein